MAVPALAAGPSSHQQWEGSRAWLRRQMSLIVLPGPCQPRQAVLGDELLAYLSAPASSASFPLLPEPSAPSGHGSSGDIPQGCNMGSRRGEGVCRKGGSAQLHFGVGVEMLQPTGEHEEIDIPAGFTC